MKLNRVEKDDPAMQKDRDEIHLTMPLTYCECLDMIAKSWDDPDLIGEKIDNFLRKNGYYLAQYDIETYPNDCGIGIVLTPNW
jgi:hypothetical protein